MFTGALLAFVCILGTTTVAADDAVKKNAGPLTVTPSGQFRGSWMESRRGRRFQAYRGIRYAEPPVGELRFQPPKPILTYSGEVDATEDGPACPQHAPPGYPVDEDCLTINVYTPHNNSSKPLPVIFFIHAGGFYSMSGRSDIAGPHYLLDRDVVLVTINYRLASLGFLSLGNKLAPGNNGFKDQVMALRWVQRNIASFGGDPHLVTIAGCSAGSLSVMLHMISPMTKGLFHRGISMSGSPFAKALIPAVQSDLALKQARVSHCPEDNTTALYHCLKPKPWKEVSGSLLGFYEFGYDPLRLWHPVIEKDFGQERYLVEEPMDSLREGRARTVPYIVSQTSDEFFWKAFTILKNKTLLDPMNSEWNRIAPISFILPRNETSDRLARIKQAYLGGHKLVNDETSTRGLGKLYGDSITGFPVHRLANLMCRHSKHPVYYYEFAYVGNHSHYEDSTTKKPLYAAHHDDLIYLFSLSYRYPMIDVSDSHDSKMVDKMTAIWYNFARYGDPNPRDDTPELSSVTWPTMKPGQRNYLRLGQEFSVHQNLSEDRFKLWDELYPIVY
ncbi:venom carboxylesterase-6-like isoform X2 [Trichoplusia ni]|uniref:Carboxylic ester hydrolase n=1 Tax=Trichoplusia ni TaxID=7111 RepID=A0A7E5W5R1_TRINI|nr:venom carboxylesterase-6-like isoform X2 [Trichoplusia ni]